MGGVGTWVLILYAILGLYINYINLE